MIQIKMNYDDPPEGHPDYYDYYDYNYTGDWGWDTDPKVMVPGFGFVPAKVDAKLNAMTQVKILDIFKGYKLKGHSQNFSLFYENFPCSSILKPFPPLKVKWDVRIA